MSSKLVLLLILMVASTRAKPVDSSIDESINKIDYGTPREAKNSIENANQLSDTTRITDQTENLTPTTIDTTTPNSQETTTAKPGHFSWFLTPLTQNLQFSPQSFLQDRIVQIKEALNNLGLQVVQRDGNGKQFGNGNGLLQIVGANDSGFYTNRLEPAGFLGGNGWFANKGGILGGPGAVLSTGSLLTDYPTPYRKK